MRLTVNTSWRKPRNLYILIDVNGNKLSDINSRELECYNSNINVKTIFRGLGRRQTIFPLSSGVFPFSVGVFPFSGLINFIWKRPRHVYNLIDTNGNSLSDANNRVLECFKHNINIQTVWR